MSCYLALRPTKVQTFSAALVLFFGNSFVRLAHHPRHVLATRYAVVKASLANWFPAAACACCWRSFSVNLDASSPPWRATSWIWLAPGSVIGGTFSGKTCGPTRSPVVDNGTSVICLSRPSIRSFSLFKSAVTVELRLPRDRTTCRIF